MATKNVVPRADGEGGIGTAAKGWGNLFITNTTADSPTQGAKIVLAGNDGAAMQSGSRLGVIEFKGQEGSALTIGGRIECTTDAVWSGSENGASLEFYTTDGDASESVALTLDSNNKATVAGDIQVGGGDVFGPTDGDFNFSSDGNMTFNIDADDDESSQAFTFKDNSADCLQISQAGVLTALGAIGGTNYRTIWIDAGAMIPTVTGGALAGTEELATNDVMLDYFAFDTSVDEKVQFKMVMPEQWDHGTMKVKFYWKTSNTDTGTVAWFVQAVAHDDSAVLDTAFGTAVTATADAGSGTDNDLHITAASAAMTVAGSPGEGELVLFQIYRDVSADTYNADAHLLGVNIQYQERATASVAW